MGLHRSIATTRLISLLLATVLLATLDRRDVIGQVDTAKLTTVLADLARGVPQEQGRSAPAGGTASIAMRIRPWLMVPTSFPLVGPAGTGASVSAHRSTPCAIDLVPAGWGPLLLHAVTATVMQTSKDARHVLMASMPFSRGAFQSI